MNQLLRYLNRIAENHPWTNVYGTARSILALSTLLTLVFNDAGTLFRPVLSLEEFPMCQGIGKISIFCLFNNNLELARYLSIAILLVTVSGWRPMVTGILHWWVSFSLTSSAILIDGGDHVTTVLTFLLIPITLTDTRKWHWSGKRIDSSNSLLQQSRSLLAQSSLFMLRLQVAIIYAHAAVGKCSVEEWANGTAVYYWFTDEQFGAAPGIRPFIDMLIESPVMVSFLTWGVILLEFLLFLGLVAGKKYKSVLLIIGIIFHVLIALVQGLFSFGLTMIGALILLLRPIDKTFGFKRKLTSQTSTPSLSPYPLSQPSNQTLSQTHGPKA